MGKKAQIRREKIREVEKEQRAIIEAKRREKEPWLYFWRRADFWIYTVAIVLVIAFPFINPSLAKWKEKMQTNTPVTKTIPATEAVMHTSLGDISLKLYAQDSPKTVENFTTLAKRGYYNNLTFHRVIKDFMIQGGDPKGDGTGGVSAWGGQFEDEFNSHKIVAGSLAMANSGANTNGSQFFIVTEQPQPHLDGKHTNFGEVTSGMEVVKAIAAVEVDENDKPKEPVLITGIDVK